MDGTTPLTNGHAAEGILVTRKFASFVSDTKYDTLNPVVVQKLKELLLDHIGVASNAACNAESSQPFVDAILAFGGSKGASTVYAKGQTLAIQYAALLNGAFAHTYDFDDTFAAGALHPGASVIPAALAQSESSNADCKTLLIALAVGYEVVCRLARALGAGSYERGFHNTGTAGIFGAIAAVGKVKNLSSDVIETAFGIAGSKAAGSMQFLENGSWNKRLHPGFAAHDALLCVALAEAGLKGSSRAFEGGAGFLHSYTDKAELKGLIDGLGNEWIFTGTAIKPYPACRMTHTSIELAEKISKEKTVAVESITVALSPTCWNIVGVPKPNKIRPENTVDAQFSNYIQTAIAWLHGSDIGWAAYQKIYDPDIRDLSIRVRCVSDKDVVSLAAKLTVRWQDGTEREEYLDAPLGEASNPMSFDKVQSKFLSLTRSVYGEKSAVLILDIVKDLERYSSADLVSLLK
jgi:2-methylcitrate dehydratase PrpD